MIRAGLRPSVVISIQVTRDRFGPQIRAQKVSVAVRNGDEQRLIAGQAVADTAARSASA